MKRLVLPILLVLASLIAVIVFTTITASTLASYSEDGQSNKTLIIEQANLKATAQR
jgi:hypothetical protein